MILLECKMEKQNSLCEIRQPLERLHVGIRNGSLSITTPVSPLANGFDVQSVLQVLQQVK